MEQVEQIALVQDYIDQNIFHSDPWDELSSEQKGKAVNNASMILKTYHPQLFADEIPVHDLADQVLWILKKDDTVQRAEMGVTSMSVEGMSVSFDQKERPIAPSILIRYNLEESGRRRRCGSYFAPRIDTSRTGIQNIPFSKSGRWD